jgi:anaerobic selenocysteine-containing dehydrogenase
LDCPDTCSLSVTVDAGRIIKVDGSHRNPFTEGFICAKVRRSPERVYSPLRLLYPQKRVGPKGEGRFARISWEEAIDTIAQRFSKIIERDGAEAILPYHYGGSNGLLGEGALDARFFHRLGASELLKTICAAPTSTTYRAMFGAMGGVPPEDYHLARAIVLWGVNPSATSIHLVPKVRAAQDAGAFVAVIDPRRTPLAKAADLHLRPLPGTDVLLALAVIHELIHSGKVDQGFVADHVNGFDELARAAADVSPTRAATVCGVAERDIACLAERYAASSPAVVRCGWGIERNRNGGNAVRAVLALAAVAGKFGVRGGGVTMSLGRAYPINNAALGRPDLRRRPVRKINMTQLGRALTEPQTPPLRALFVYNANPVAVTPNQNLILRGLARDDLFTVVHEQVMTDTAVFADILLPATTMFEQRNLLKSYGSFRLQQTEPVIDAVGESKSNVELFPLLARAMGFDEPELFAGEDALIDAALDGAEERLDGGRARLRTEGIASLTFGGRPEVVQFVTTFPTTASHRIELCPPELGAVQYQAPPSSEFPLQLISPATSRTINSIFGEFNLQHPVLDLHPDDAAARGIADGQLVRAYNELGEVHVPVRVTEEVRPGVVCLPKGMWRSSTRNGATVTALVPDHLTDIGDGACFNDARIEVAPLAAGAA